MSRSKLFLRSGAGLMSVLFFTFCGVQSGCSQNLYGQPKVGVDSMSSEVVANDKVELKVKVILSKPNSLHDDFMDGTSKSYDMTVFEALEPAAYKGVRLRVVNEHVPGFVPMRVEVGKEYMIEVSYRNLKDSGAFISPESVRVLSEI